MACHTLQVDLVGGESVPASQVLGGKAAGRQPPQPHLRQSRRGISKTLLTRGATATSTVTHNSASHRILTAGFLVPVLRVKCTTCQARTPSHLLLTFGFQQRANSEKINLSKGVSVQARMGIVAIVWLVVRTPLVRHASQRHFFVHHGVLWPRERSCLFGGPRA